MQAIVQSPIMKNKGKNMKLNKVLPHGPLINLFDNIWYIQGQVKMPMLFPPMRISKTMTVIKNPQTNELTLINAMPLNKETLNEIEQLGEIKNTLRVGGYHGRDDNYYKHHYNVKVYAIKGQCYEKKFEKVPGDPKNKYFQADVLLDENSELPVPNATLKLFKSSNPIEGILHIHENGGILITADSLHNTANADEYCNWGAKIFMKKFGFFKAYNVGPGWVQFAKPSLKDIRSILDLDFDHVIPGHGPAVIGGAKQKYRPVIEADIKGCHE